MPEIKTYFGSISGLGLLVRDKICPVFLFFFNTFFYLVLVYPLSGSKKNGVSTVFFS